LKDREAMARLRNGKWGARETCFEQWSQTRLQCALWHHLVETTHWHSLFFFGAVLSTTHSKDVRFPWVTLYIIVTVAQHWPAQLLWVDASKDTTRVGG
jgi:membrane protein insertase Oxa1/YidC/SpoIIIJ